MIFASGLVDLWRGFGAPLFGVGAFFVFLL